jgi:hypothetical protein
MTQSSVQESRVRRKATRLGYSVHKSRERKHVPHSRNFGEFMLTLTNTVMLGDKYDAPLDHIEAFLNEVDTSLAN